MTVAERIAVEMPGQTMTEAQPVTRYDELISLVRVRIAQLDITYDTLAEVSGLSKSIIEKILATPPKKHLSVFSMFSLLGALALLPKFEHDGERLELLQKRSQWMRPQRPGPQYRPRLSVAK